MPDLADLEHTWTVLEARADAHALPDLGAPPRSSRRGRPALVAAAGVMVAAVALGGVVLSNRSAPATRTHTRSGAVSVAVSRPATDDGPGWTTLPAGHYLVVVEAIPGASIRSVIGVGNARTLVQPGDAYQEVQVVGPPDGLVIKVNAPGSWAPSGGQQVSFDGRDAYFGTFLRHPELPGHPVPPRVSLAWQYQPGAWATIGSLTETPINLADAEHYAGLVRIAEGDALPDPLPQDR
jgi:hypothetical protein